MIKVLMAAVAATFAVNANAAEVSVSEACGHLDNHSRFNPTELSEYQECWLDIHGEESGVLGSLFYTKVGESYVSMPTKVLREAGSKAAAKAVVVEAIIAGVAQAEYDAVVAERDALQSDLAAAVTGRDFETASDLADEIDRLNTRVDELGMVDAEFLSAAVTRAHGRMTDDPLNESNLDSYDRTSTGHNGALTATNERIGWETVTRLQIAGGQSSIQAVSDLRVLNAAIDHAFDSGFDAGYDEGYADGYRDGFADGVASVR